MPKGIVTIIGNLAIDRVYIEKSLVGLNPGGTAFYGGMALARLQADVELVSKIGVDYPDRFLKILEGAFINLRSVSRSKSHHSTSFSWRYSTNLSDREGSVSCRGPTITPEDIPKHINKSECVQFGMVAGELDPEVLSSLDFESIPMACADLHFIREISEDGRIRLGQGAIFRPFLQKIHVLKGSTDEIKAFANTGNLKDALQKISSMGPKILFATNGAYGSVLCAEGELFEIPAYIVKEVDTTGAGDIFLSSFLFFYGLKREDPVESAYLASAAASFGVEAECVSRLGEEEEIRERADLLRQRTDSTLHEGKNDPGKPNEMSDHRSR